MKIGTITIAATYFVAVAVSIVMAHANNTAALSFRDRLVSKARTHDPGAIADAAGHRTTAAFIDLGRNLLLGAIPSTLADWPLCCRIQLLLIVVGSAELPR